MASPGGILLISVLTGFLLLAYSTSTISGCFIILRELNSSCFFNDGKLCMDKTSCYAKNEFRTDNFLVKENEPAYDIYAAEHLAFIYLFVYTIYFVIILSLCLVHFGTPSKFNR